MCGVQYYCTAGRGLEHFLAEEVRRKLSPTQVDVTTGKVLFTTSSCAGRVRALRCAERAFVKVRQEAPVNVTAGQCVDVIQQRVVGDVHTWSEAFSRWRRLQAELNLSSTAVTGRGEKRKRQEDEEERAGGGDAVQTDRSAVRFRVCCKASGAVTKCTTAQALGAMIGRSLSKRLGWRADLKDPELEVSVQLSDEHCLVGFPLLRLPLAHRTYIKRTGLRATVAWAMTSLANIRPGCCVLDPMCGVGTVLLEAATECEGTFCLGMDTDASQLVRAAENVQFAKLEGRVELARSSVIAIPLPSCSVDAVVCDMPFGRKFGTKDDVAASLLASVVEMHRVLRVGGVLVLLLSPQLSSLLGKNINSSQPLLSPLGRHRVSLGASDGLIHAYRRLD